MFSGDSLTSNSATFFILRFPMAAQRDSAQSQREKVKDLQVVFCQCVDKRVDIMRMRRVCALLHSLPSLFSIYTHLYFLFAQKQTQSLLFDSAWPIHNIWKKLLVYHMACQKTDITGVHVTAADKPIGHTIQSHKYTSQLFWPTRLGLEITSKSNAYPYR